MARTLADLGAYPQPVARLVEALTRLPGVGRRSAERMAFHILKSSGDEAVYLAQAIADVKQTVKVCSICFAMTDIDPCATCCSPQRDASIILVVEQYRDLLSLEQTGMYRGVYHVLTGSIDPLADVHPDDLTVIQLLDRVSNPERNSRGQPVREVILGLNPNLEGDSTALYLAAELAKRAVQVTRLARGLPAGSQLEYANSAVLAEAIQGRQSMAADPIRPTR